MLLAIPCVAGSQEVEIGTATPDTMPPPAIGRATYQLAAFVSPGNGFVKDVYWLNNDEFLGLMVTPAGASVWRYSYTASTREKFLSSQFIEQHICPAEFAGNLRMVLSPGRRFAFFNYFRADGSFGYALLDIASAPNFRLKRFNSPAGMQVNDVLFSPDDHYVVLFHDAYQGGCELSLLVLDLELGTEHWRQGAAELGFISSPWWRVGEEPALNLVAALVNGEFHDPAGVATCLLDTRQVEYAEDRTGVLIGRTAAWGDLTCYVRGMPGDDEYYLVANVPGEMENQQVPLTSRPVMLECLAEPGLILLGNTDDLIQNQLWLLDVLSARRELVFRDCAEFDVSPAGNILTRVGNRNELRIYELTRYEQRY